MTSKDLHKEPKQFSMKHSWELWRNTSISQSYGGDQYFMKYYLFTKIFCLSCLRRNTWTSHDFTRTHSNRDAINVNIWKLITRNFHAAST